MKRLVLVVVASLALTACQGPVSPTQAGPPQNQATNQPDETAQPEDSTVPTSAATFSAIKLSGSGDKVAKFSIPEDEAGIAVISAKGADNFVVESLASDGSQNDLLVNTIGNYAGTVLFDINDGEHSVAFKIQASGPWTITIKPLASAQVWDTSKKLTGRGDGVFLIDPPASGLTTLTITGSGQDNFVVYGYSPDNGEDLLVNEIGKYSGQVALADGSNLLTISADGSWTVAED